MMQEYEAERLNQALKKFEEATARLEKERTLENATEVHTMSSRGVDVLYLIQQEDGSVPVEYRDYYCKIANEAIKSLRTTHHPPKEGSSNYALRLSQYHHMKYWASLIGIRAGIVSREIKYH